MRKICVAHVMVLTWAYITHVCKAYIHNLHKAYICNSHKATEQILWNHPYKTSYKTFRSFESRRYFILISIHLMCSVHICWEISSNKFQTRCLNSLINFFYFTFPLKIYFKILLNKIWSFRWLFMRYGSEILIECLFLLSWITFRYIP